MLPAPAKRSSAFLPALWACILAAAGFLIGRLSVGVSPSSKACPELGTDAQDPRLSSLQSDDVQTRSSGIDADGSWHPVAKDWEEIAERAGLLQGRPLLPTGYNGKSEYVIQPFQVISEKPRIIIFPNFIDRQRSKIIIEEAAKHLHTSQLALRKNDKMENVQDVRTSSGTFMSSANDPTGVLAWLDDRISAVTSIPKPNFEPFNVLRYELGQHYDAHHDLFKPSEYGKQDSQRVATVLVYLEAPDEGGETIFPLEGLDGRKNLKGFNFKTCDRGYRYQPRSGDAVLFWSVTPDNTFDEQSLHGGCPVKVGAKWVATKWIRDKPRP